MINIEHLTKRFGDKYALVDVGFKASEGEIVGFLGPNGAGKSTTMNILTGYLSYEDGKVEIDGYDILDNPGEAKKRIGYLPEVPPLYPEMTVKEYLNFVYELKRCTLSRKKHINEIMEVTKISDVKNSVIAHLSKGYKQRVGIAQALVGNPKVLIFDEPTVGLDPRQIIEVRNLIRTLGMDHTVILSTHVLSEVKAVCDRVVIINRGKIVADKKVDEIASASTGSSRLNLKICGAEKEIVSALKSIPDVVSVESLGRHDADSTTFSVECRAGIDPRKTIFNTLARAGLPIIGEESVGVNLEDVFLQLTDRPEPKKKRSLGAERK